ncbi:MAG: regulatory protein RecX [Candidatus Omnitrophota bacterium]|nr:MAG: regulatory protein RecX [Candidatus Omnitrophota bacterium]
MDAFKYANILLRYRPRSYKELVQRLEKKGYRGEEIENTMQKLGESGLVDDREFCKFWINYRLNYNPRSRKFLEMELKRKGVDEEIISEVLSQIPDFKERDIISELVEHRMRSLRGVKDPVVKKRRIYTYLARRGFSYSQIREAVSQAMRNGK